MSEAPAWLPTPDDVATVIARFLPDRVGAVDGGWSEDASPTEAQVQTLISSAGSAISASGVTPVSTELEPVAKSATAYRAAAEVVLAFFPEADLDYVKMLRSWSDDLLRRLGISDGAGTGSGGDVTPATPVGSYPQPTCLPDIW